MTYLKVRYLLHVLLLLLLMFSVVILYVFATHTLILAPVPTAWTAIVVRWHNGFYLSWHLNNALRLYYTAAQTVLHKANLLDTDHLLMWIEKLPASLVMADRCTPLKNNMVIVSQSCLMTYTEILANFIELTQVMCVSREKKGEEWIPTLFPLESLKNFSFFDNNSHICSFRSFPAITFNQKKSQDDKLIEQHLLLQFTGKIRTGRWNWSLACRRQSIRDFYNWACLLNIDEQIFFFQLPMNETHSFFDFWLLWNTCGCFTGWVTRVFQRLPVTQCASITASRTVGGNAFELPSLLFDLNTCILDGISPSSSWQFNRKWWS